MKSVASAVLVMSMAYFVAVSTFQMAGRTPGAAGPAAAPEPPATAPAPTASHPATEWESPAVRAFPGEQLRREGVGAALSEDDAESDRRPGRTGLAQMPRGACRAFFGGVLHALGDDGAHIPRNGPSH